MLATCIIVGSIAEAPVIEKDEKGNTDCWMSVETARPFRSFDNSLGKDRFRVKLWRGIAAECASACSTGDVVVIRGRLQSETSSESPQVQIIAEKVSWLRGLRA